MKKEVSAIVQASKARVLNKEMLNKLTDHFKNSSEFYNDKHQEVVKSSLSAIEKIADYIIDSNLNLTDITSIITLVNFTFKEKLNKHGNKRRSNIRK